MSPKSRPRKKKPQQKTSGRRREEQRSPFAPLLASAAVLLEQTSPLSAELWASELYGSMWLGAWKLDPDEYFDVFEEEYERLVEGLGELKEPAALATLRALSQVGEKWSRLAAQTCADRLAAAGVPEPVWSKPAPVEFVSAGVVTDLLGDLDAVAVAFRRADYEYTMLFMIQATIGVGEIQLFGTPEEGLEALLRDLVESTEDTFRDEITSLTAGQAWTRVWPALDEFLDEEPDDEAHAALLDHDDLEHPIQSLALALTWMEPLEPDTPESPVDHSDRVPAVVEAFLASPHAASLDPFAARKFASVAAQTAVTEGRSPDAYGPLSLASTLVGSFAAALRVTPEDMALFPELVRAWAYFTADHRGLPAELARARWDEALPDVLADFTDAYADRTVAVHRRANFRD